MGTNAGDLGSDYAHEAPEQISLIGQAICKDCGNGTLNNYLNEQFILNDDSYVVCKHCGSSHIDGELEAI